MKYYELHVCFPPPEIYVETLTPSEVEGGGILRGNQAGMRREYGPNDGIVRRERD